MTGNDASVLAPVNPKILQAELLIQIIIRSYFFSIFYIPLGEKINKIKTKKDIVTFKTNSESYFCNNTTANLKVFLWDFHMIEQQKVEHVRAVYFNLFSEVNSAKCYVVPPFSKLKLQIFDIYLDQCSLAFSLYFVWAILIQR